MIKTKLYISILIFLLFGFMTGNAAADLAHPSQADSAKECAICHFRWVNDFFVKGKGTPLTPIQTETVVGDRKMCLSCHDGSVRDSRDKICNDPGHRVGNIPSDGIKIPSKFPLGEKGEMLCTTCHTPHAIAATDEYMKVDFFLRAPNVNSSFCKMCHVDRVGDEEKGNHPVDISAKKPPKAIIKAGGKLGTEMKNQIICETCHIPHGGVNNRFLVLSTEDPKTRSVLCEVCHTKKPGMADDPSLNRFSHPMDLVPGKSTEIPEKWNNGEEVVLGVGGELVCRTCHKPHNAADADSLLADHKGKNYLCIQCHKNESAIQDSSHDLRLSAPDEINILKKKASSIGSCDSCHLVHSGTGSYMWAKKKENKSQGSEEDMFCKSCHSSGQCSEKEITQDFSHPMNVSLQSVDAPDNLPLYDKKGNRNKKGVIMCMTCHNVHDPKPVFSIPGEKEKKETFLRLKGNDPSNLCLNCHPQHGLVAGTDHDMFITVPDFKNAKEQSYFVYGLCSPCHSAHNTVKGKFLWSAPLGPAYIEGWRREFTSENNAMTSVCTGCHSYGNIAKEQVPEFGFHPKGLQIPEEKLGRNEPVIPFEMLKKEYPIYNDSGEIDETGNIVCSTCHNPHQWDPDDMIKGPGKAVEGNVTNSFLRPRIHENLCAGCHDEDGIFKFKYFHSHFGREEEKSEFPFSKDQE